MTHQLVATLVVHLGSVFLFLFFLSLSLSLSFFRYARGDVLGNIMER